MWGGTGCGKTMLMDLFYDSAPTNRKKRQHFSAFMLDVNERMLVKQQEREKQLSQGFLRRVLPKISDDIGGTADTSGVSKISLFGMTIVLNSGEGAYGALDKNNVDPLPIIAREMIGESSLICLDEFEVTDVADAFIITRLFEALFNEGVVLVATSNREPAKLYDNGLNRSVFVPTIQKIEDNCEVVSLHESSTDYRLRKGRSNAHNRFAFGHNSHDRLIEMWNKRTNSDNSDGGKVITRANRKVVIPRVGGDSDSCAFFSFKELTHDHPMGASDFAMLTQEFDSIFVGDILNFNTGGCSVDGLRRWVLFIDAAYDAKVELFFSSIDSDIPDLWDENKEVVYGSGNVNKLGDIIGNAFLVPVDTHTQFSLARSISRMIEMTSDGYLSSSTERVKARAKERKANNVQ
jgi:predicted ATPase